MPRDGIERATELVMRESYPNPRPLEAEAIAGLIQRAHAGEAPVAA